MKFGYTIVYVESVTATFAFYQAAFGFATRFLHDSEQYGELETGSTTLAFATHAMGEMNLPAGYIKSTPDSLPLGVELAFIADDVDAAYERALAAGAMLVAEQKDKPWGQRVAYVRAIEGSLIEICSPMSA